MEQLHVSSLNVPDRLPKNPNSIGERLRSIRKSLQNLSISTLQCSSSECTLPHTSLSLQKENNDPSSKKSELETGLSLFGENPIEKEIELKLTRLEDEVKLLMEEKAKDAPPPDTETQEAEIIEETENDAPPHLLLKIAFLQKCITARSLLEESTTIISPTTTSPRSRGDTPQLVSSASLLSRVASTLNHAEIFLDNSNNNGDNNNNPRDQEMGRKIIAAIRSQARRRHVSLRSRASALIDESVTMSDGKLVVEGGDAHLKVAYDVLTALGGTVLNDAVWDLATTFESVVLKPLIEESIGGGVYQFRENVSKDDDRWGSSVGGGNDHNNGGTVVLEWRKRTTTTTTPGADLSDKVGDKVSMWAEMTKGIKTVLNFFHEQILLKKKELSGLVGQFLFGSDVKEGPLSQSLLQMVRLCIPDTPSTLPMITPTIQSIVQSFRDDLLSQGYIDNEHAFPLIGFANSIEAQYANKRRNTYLKQARDILLKEDYHNTIIVGEVMPKQKSPETAFVKSTPIHSPFILPRLAISQVASLTLKLCRETLDEAISSTCPKATSPTLYKASREIFDLFRAIIPVLHHTTIATIPRTAAILHNDCFYFAHHALTLGLEYQAHFPENIRPAVTFIDFVPVFRDIANGTLSRTISRQKTQLAEIIVPRVSLLNDALRMNEAVTEWTEAERGVRAVHYHLHHLSQAWRTILSRDTYARAMGNLVDAFLAILLEKVLKVKDVSEAACHFVEALFRDVRRVEELFEGGEDEARKFCELWERFGVVGRFVGMSLADVSRALGEGFFRCLTGPELRGLVVACFGDSEARKQILMVLSDG